MRIKWWHLLAVLGYGPFLAAQALAQAGNGADNLDWVESPVPPPPSFSGDGLIPIDMPIHVSVKVGVDPQTIAVGPDGVVRYVIVVTNSTGNMNAVYEGIRCITDEVKTYARFSASGQWTLTANPAWKSITDNMPSKHAHAFARQGGCQSRLATSQGEIIAALKRPQRPVAGKLGN